MKSLLVKVCTVVLTVLFIFTLTACETENNQSSSSSITDTCTVIFKDYDGSVLKTCEVEKGGSVQPPEPSPKKGYEFFEWDRKLENITESLTVEPRYLIVNNQLFFDYQKEDDKLKVTFSLAGDVKVCGFEGYVSYTATNLTFGSVNACENEVAEVNFANQGDKIKVFFFHDQIENITEEIDILTFEFEELESSSAVSFDVDITVFVDKDFEPLTFSVANENFGV